MSQQGAKHRWVCNRHQHSCSTFHLSVMENGENQEKNYDVKRKWCNLMHLLWLVGVFKVRFLDPPKTCSPFIKIQFCLLYTYNWFTLANTFRIKYVALLVRTDLMTINCAPSWLPSVTAVRCCCYVDIEIHISYKMESTQWQWKLICKTKHMQLQNRFTYGLESRNSNF